MSSTGRPGGLARRRGRRQGGETCFVDWSHVIPGLTGGVVSSMVCYPLELCETHIQARSASPPSKRVQNIPVPRPPEAAGDRNALKPLFESILAKKGVPGLYDGLDGAMLSALFGWTTFFAAMNQLDVLLPTDGAVAGLPLQLLKTSTAGLAAAIVNTPFQNIKTRRILNPKLSTPEVLHAITVDSSPETHRLRVDRLWTGLGPCLLGVSTEAVQFTAFYMLASQFAFCESPALAALFGGVSMLIAGLLTYPVIVLKTTVMAEKNRPQAGGIREWYSGLTPYILRTVPPSAVLFAVQRTVECSSSF